MKLFIISTICLLLPILSQAQFTPSEKGLTIIVTDGTDGGKRSTQQPSDSTQFKDPIRPLGMTDAIQAGAFLERPAYGMTGFLLVFCVNDSIDDRQGVLNVNGEYFYGVYRLIRQKVSADEEIPEGMAPYRLSGTVYFLGIS